MLGIHAFNTFCRSLRNAVSLMNASDSEMDHEGLNDAMVEESDGSDASEVDDIPIFSKCMPTYTCIILYSYPHI